MVVVGVDEAAPSLPCSELGRSVYCLWFSFERVRGTKGGTVLLLRYLRKAEDAKGSKGQEKEVIYY